MRKFNEIYALACLHKGGADKVESMLPRALSASELEQQSDAFYLSQMSRRVFRAGLKHSMVDAKWPNFEQVFSGFDPAFCAMMSDEFIEACMGDARIIRHFGKLKSIRQNAQYLQSVNSEYGGFGQYLASKSASELIELWAEFKKHGAHLGGASGPQFLRMVGFDTFLLTQDVVAVLIYDKVIDTQPTSKRQQRLALDAFLQWQQESARPLCEISRIISFAAL